MANGAPNLSLDIPAMLELARQHDVPITGKDFKTGQTLMKTILAPGLQGPDARGRAAGTRPTSSATATARCSTTPSRSRARRCRSSACSTRSSQPERYPELYGDIHHVVRINYYPPRGDNKEGWDNIDIFGWLGYPMQIKIDFLCRDSILAAPIVLDLALFLDLAKRAGMSGVQEWLQLLLEEPAAPPDGVYPEHDLFIQLMKLKNTLRHLKGDELITHLGAEYYD